MGRLAVGGLLGLFGGGPLSHSTARDPQGVLEVDYPRFDRNIGYASLALTVDGDAAQDGTVTVFFSDEWISEVLTQDISPEPDSATRTEAGISYEFTADPAAPLVVEITYRPGSIGVRETTVSVGDSGTATLWQLTYP